MATVIRFVSCDCIALCNLLSLSLSIFVSIKAKILVSLVSLVALVHWYLLVSLVSLVALEHWYLEGTGISWVFLVYTLIDQLCMMLGICIVGSESASTVLNPDVFL